VPRARYLIARRMGPIGLALTAWDVWRRIPKRHRQRILRQARKQLPVVARGVARQIRTTRDAYRKPR
jgi:hypothetical protein